MYQEGIGVFRDDEKAAYYYQMGADRNEPTAQFNLGWMYQRGRGVVRDEEMAVKYYRLAADGGMGHAQVALGIMHLYGVGQVEQDESIAAHYYKLAADQGHLDGIGNLGYLYYLGKGVEKDERKGLDMIRSVVEKGHIDMSSVLGSIYLRGAPPHLTKDVEKGMLSCLFCFCFVFYFVFSRCVSQNFILTAHNTGFSLIQFSAENGNESALYTLGMMHRRGSDPLPAKDAKKAANLFAHSGVKGYTHAWVPLSNMYEKGEGVAQDNAKALSLLKIVSAIEDDEEAE